MKNFGEILEGELHKRGITATALGRAVDISPSGMSNYRNGRVPKADELLRIAEFLGVSMEYLLTGAEKAAGKSLAENPTEYRVEKLPPPIPNEPKKDDPQSKRARAKPPQTNRLELIEQEIRELISDPAWVRTMELIRNSNPYFKTIDRIRSEVRECIQEGRAPSKDLLLLINEIEQVLIGIAAESRAADISQPPRIADTADQKAATSV